MRLDFYLATHWPENSRTTWQKHCRQGHILVNGQAQTSPSAQLDEDDIVTLNIPKEPDFSNQNLPVIYQDKDVVVIDKPAGILTHAKGSLNTEFSVGEFMRSRTNEPTSNRPGIVHRLDRQTSGVIITAKTQDAKSFLQKQFSQRKVKKTYLALVEGRPKHSNAKIELPIERNPTRPQLFRVAANGKPAITEYQTLKNYKKYTLLKLKPLTGRTHQLRVHLSYVGCPIVGDLVYGSPAPKTLDRMFLHAAELQITLPNRKRTVFKAPLPTDLENFLEQING